MNGEERFCRKCGNRLEPGSVYCIRCGTRVLMDRDATLPETDTAERIPPAIHDRVHQLLVEKKYIEAIRCYRESTSQPLKESKAAIDAYIAGNGIDAGADSRARTLPFRCAGAVLGFFLWMAFIGAMPFAAQWLAPRVFGPGISRGSIETCMALLPIIMVMFSLVLFFLVLSSRRRRAGGSGEPSFGSGSDEG
ncbi:MAG: zinc ribbon domain-containing protein [Candidatus Fermentibacteraceae bacterium]